MIKVIVFHEISSNNFFQIFYLLIYYELLFKKKTIFGLLQKPPHLVHSEYTRLIFERDFTVITFLNFISLKCAQSKNHSL